MGNDCVFAVFYWCPLLSEYFCLFYNIFFFQCIPDLLQYDVRR